MRTDYLTVWSAVMSELLTIRDATMADIPAILRLMVDDDLRRANDSTDPADLPVYERAFAVIDADPQHTILLGELPATETGMQPSIVASLQLSFLPGLTNHGAWRGHVENVRVASSHRGKGLGHQLMQAAIERCQARGCRLVQLTTDKRRERAKRFYESLGFVATHEGMKLRLDE